MKEIIVIGGGASGITAAIFAAEKGAKVTVLEKEKTPMKKLARTGNGRCNISNMNIDENSFLSNKHLRAYELYKQFDSTQTFAFFERLGIPVINKGKNELYPACESAASVVKILKIEAENMGIRLKNSEYVKDIMKDKDRFIVCTDTWKYEADKVILACGTNASTGCSDELITEKAAKKFSLNCHPYLPALARLYSEGDFLKKWAGVRVFGIIRLYVDNMYVTENFGELQLTDCGISGIPVFDISRYVNLVYAMKKHTQHLEIDFFPDLGEEQLQTLLIHLMHGSRKGSRKTLKQACLGLLPERLIDAVLENDFSAEQAAAKIKSFRLPITGPSKISESQVCTGGMDLDEIDNRMQCRKVPGLFFCGEALDVDGSCGGFNLQWAWSTGAIAGMKAAE